MGSANKDLSVSLTDHELTGVLEQGSEFEGKLCFTGTLRINGVFRGEIFSPDVLVIGQDAKVHADIDVGSAIIAGELRGNIIAKHRVEFLKPAVFRGEITTPSLSIDEGVIFEGSSRMRSNLTSETVLDPQN